MSEPVKKPFASRGGIKLQHALDRFALDVRGFRCADFGCNLGGFTDCLLRAGAAHVIAVDTGYGTLAWTLRQDPRVHVLERTNALHAAAPSQDQLVDLVVIDMAWTPQRLCVPAALKWLKPGGRIISLIKPHYEKTSRPADVAEDSARGEMGEPSTHGSASSAPRASQKQRSGAHGKSSQVVLDVAQAQAIVDRVLAQMPSFGAVVLACTSSPIEGGAGKSKGHAKGNHEWLAILSRAEHH